MEGYNIAIVGATGLVGMELVRVIRGGNFPVKRLFLFASSRKRIEVDGVEYEVNPVEEAEPDKLDIAFFATDSDISKRFVPIFISSGVFVIDKSRAFRYEPDVPLIIPEINGFMMNQSTILVANPNCTTTQLAITLEPIRNLAKIEKVVAVSCQSVSGAGMKALDYFNGTINENPFPFEIKNNIIPFIGERDSDNYCTEENTILKEINKIFGETIDLSVSTLRVPVSYSHSISVWVRLKERVSLERVIDSFTNFPGVEYSEDPPPMPITARGKDSVFVGCLKRDKYDPLAFSFFSVCDNLRKGAATNAYQIAELAHRMGII